MIAAIQRCFVQKVFLEISQNSQENTGTRVSSGLWFIEEESLAEVLFLWILWVTLF